MNILFQIILGVGTAVVITALLANPIGIFIKPSKNTRDFSHEMNWTI